MTTTTHETWSPDDPPPIVHTDFQDMTGDVWHWNEMGYHWTSESGDDPDPDALLTEVSSLRLHIRRLQAYIRGLTKSRTLP